MDSNNPEKIAVQFTLTAYPPSMGGAQRHAHGLALELAKSGIMVDVLAQWNSNRTDWLLGTTRNRPQLEDWAFEGIDVKAIQTLSNDFDRRRLLLLLHYAFPRWTTPSLSIPILRAVENRMGSPSIIHHFRIGRELLAFASLDLARTRGVPFVLTPFHHPRWRGWRYREWVRIYREADLLFALTKSEQAILCDLGVDPQRIRVVGHGIDRLQDTASSPPTLPATILFLGQHYGYKGWKQLLRAAPLVWEKHPTTRFEFAGPSVDDSEKHFVGVDTRIKQYGVVSDSLKHDLLNSCTALCLPSTQESFGGVFTEAWSFGKPVIACPIPAVSELVEHGVNGLLCKQTPQEIAGAILRLLDAPLLANQMGESGRQKVALHFTWDKIASAVLNGYEWALAHSRSSPFASRPISQ